MGLGEMGGHQNSAWDVVVLVIYGVAAICYKFWGRCGVQITSLAPSILLPCFPSLS